MSLAERRIFSSSLEGQSVSQSGCAFHPLSEPASKTPFPPRLSTAFQSAARARVSDRIGRRVTRFESRSPSFFVQERWERNEDGLQRRNENGEGEGGRERERKMEEKREVDGIPARRSKNSPLLPLALFFPSRRPLPRRGVTSSTLC